VNGHAQVRGATLAYEQAGTGLDVIWGHGLSQTRRDENVLALIDWSRVPARVTRYDARGHAGYHWDALARDQLALADHLGIDTYVAAGASMGCGTALHAAVQAPRRVAALVLVIPPTAWETRATQAEMWAQSAATIEHDGVEPMIEARAAMPLPDPLASRPDQRERQAEATRRWDPTRLAHVMRGAAGADLPSRDAVAAIVTPTLILAWTGDPVHPLTTADELASLIPHADTHVASTAEDLAGWTDLMAAFVAEHHTA